MHAIYRLFAAVSLVLVLSCPAFAQEKTYSVMLIMYRGVTDAERGFTEYLKHRLPVEFLLRDADGDRTKVKDFLAEAKEKKVDLIYTFGTSVTLETVGAVDDANTQGKITDIPVVFNIVTDPVGARLADNLSATGRNLTGVSHVVPMSAQLTAMKRYKPVKKLGVIYNPNEPNSLSSIQQLRQQAAQFQFNIVEAPIASNATLEDRDISNAMQGLIAAKPDFIYLPSDSTIISRAKIIVDAANEVGIPTLSATEGPIRDSGALLGLVSKYESAGQFAGYKAEQILMRKERIEAIPIETLRHFTIVVNMKTAKKLNLWPPLDIIKIAELL